MEEIFWLIVMMMVCFFAFGGISEKNYTPYCEENITYTCYRYYPSGFGTGASRVSCNSSFDFYRELKQNNDCSNDRKKVYSHIIPDGDFEK